MYHLDGEAAIKHLDSLMSLDKLNCLQWSPGEPGPDGTQPQWDIVYDKATAAGKSIWVHVFNGGVDDWIRGADHIVQRYGGKGTFLWFPEMSLADADKLLAYADRHWC
jgi:5-methyltetrahydrofolate--homocysteine methyltransferase